MGNPNDKLRREIRATSEIMQFRLADGPLGADSGVVPLEQVLNPNLVRGHQRGACSPVNRRSVMTSAKLAVISLSVVIALSGCGSRTEKAGVSEPTRAASPTEAPASQPVASPTPVSTPEAPKPVSAPPAEVAKPPEPVKPPEPKKYIVAAGTPISVRTIGEVNTKAAKNGNEFEATLESPLVVDGHTVAKRGATVVGRVVNADQGGRVKGKASLTLALARLQLTSGQTMAIQTNTVTQEAKSGTGKNLKRTGIATGAGAAIGAIAGGGKGAAIGAGVGAGAGVATNLATRGPAAEIPAETTLNFSLTKDFVVTERR
jgi:hypothetical protein